MGSYQALCFNFVTSLQALLSFLFCKISKLFRTLTGTTFEDPTNPQWIHSLLKMKFDHHVPTVIAVEKSPDSLPGLVPVTLIYRIQLEYIESPKTCTEVDKLTPASSSSSAYPRSLVVKQGRDHFQGKLFATFFSSAREATFYSTLAPRHSIFSTCVPEVYHSRRSKLTGDFTIIMEDLSGKAIPVNHMLGNQCWGPVDLPTELKTVEPLEIVRTIFGKMAEIHARFWMDESLLKMEWMRGVRWRKGGGRLSWEASFANMRDRWQALNRGQDSGGGSGGFCFTELQKNSVNKLLEGTEWGVWQRENGIQLHSRPKCLFTLAHGDFHAGNVFWSMERKEERAIFVDWSEVGIGCPFTELAQFMISNTSIDFRRQHERQIFEEYYSRVVDLGVDTREFSQEKCWELYRAGGIERWLQLLVLLVAAGVPDFTLQWFSDQVESFLQDHSPSIPSCFTVPFPFWFPSA